MKIKSICIDGYKNLNQTALDFAENDIPIAIIGNNGTGKSNLVEALIHIFLSLYYDNDPEFSYRINYLCNNKDVEIIRTKSENLFEIRVDGHVMTRPRFKKWIRAVGRMPPFPEMIFCYYSGTCQRIGRLINQYNRSYSTLLRQNTQELERLFVFPDINHAELSLLGLFAHRHVGLLNRLSLSDVRQVKITLVPPSHYKPEIDDPSFWGTTGGIREFLADLDNHAVEGYSPRNAHSDKIVMRTYVLNRKGLERIGMTLERRGTNFQSMMQALSDKKMVHDTSFELVNSQSKATYELDDLSEGEKQLLSVIGGLTLYNNPESLILLDEPDTHLNPAWSWEYDSLLKTALSDAQKEHSMVLLATHDPVIISGMTKDQVLIAHASAGQLHYTRPVRDPRGQGVANVLTSEFFGLPSSLDKYTQNLLDERLRLAYAPQRLSDAEKSRLRELNEKLEILGLTISFRDPDYQKFEERKYSNEQDQ